MIKSLEDILTILESEIELYIWDAQLHDSVLRVATGTYTIITYRELGEKYCLVSYLALRNSTEVKLNYLNLTTEQLIKFLWEHRKIYNASLKISELYL